MYTAFEMPEPVEMFQTDADLSPEDYSEKLNIPLDTVKSWFYKKSYPPVWVQNLVIKEVKNF